MELEYCAPCLFGLEGPLGNELRHMDMTSVTPENGRVYFTGGEDALPRANIRSRFAERILLVLGRFDAPDFDALFEGVKALPWEDWLPRDAAFPVKGWALESALHSVPDCQKIVKKAVVERLRSVYGIDWFPETGGQYPIQFSIMKDRAVLCLDTSGTGLHKRGYRPAQVAAPLRETLAAAIVDIARYRGRGDFCDPFCGSGTIAVEAALAAKNRAPGIGRSFLAEGWPQFSPLLWQHEREAARAREYNGDYRIFASDIDPKAVATARANARRAGVEELIEFTVADARDFSRATESGTLCANPPYGERLMEKESAAELCRAFGRAMRSLPGWKCYILSSLEQFENCFGRKADRRRRLYNGMIPCQLYMYLG
ncbi:MAG: class I SAM-dependent RNA methyltransferase [Oscillospiraceae bacterium]|nr:class I SAM-dependent RNA methyltransferase [Oscillospiraceae bacterium]